MAKINADALIAANEDHAVLAVVEAPVTSATGSVLAEAHNGNRVRSATRPTLRTDFMLFQPRESARATLFCFAGV
jgi:hypothetical protein